MDAEDCITTDDGESILRDDLEEMLGELEHAQMLCFDEGPYVLKRLYDIPQEQEYTIIPVGW